MGVHPISVSAGATGRSTRRAITIGTVAVLVLGLIVPNPIPAVAETVDTDIRIKFDRADVTEGGRITMTVETLDGQPAATDRHLYLKVDGTATQGSGADFTVTDTSGNLLPDIGDSLYDRKVVLPQGARSVDVWINTRDDSEAEQCESIRIQGRQVMGSDQAFVGVFELQIDANDLGSTPPGTLPSVDLTQNGDTWTATLTDPNGVGDVNWYWLRATQEQGPWTQVAYRTDEYTVTDADARYFLRAEAWYKIGNRVPACAHTAWPEAPPLPEVSGVVPTVLGRSSARLAVRIADPDGSSQTVYSQYRTRSPLGSWVDASETPSTTTGSAVVMLSGLAADTEYEARVSLDSSFPDDRTVLSRDFRTWPTGVSGILVSVSQTTATVTVTMTTPHGTTLYLIYRPVDGSWMSDQESVTANQTSVDFVLTGLVSGTAYELRVSYDERLLDTV